jgi:hypothetical protein
MKLYIFCIAFINAQIDRTSCFYHPNASIYGYILLCDTFVAALLRTDLQFACVHNRKPNHLIVLPLWFDMVFVDFKNLIRPNEPILLVYSPCWSGGIFWLWFFNQNMRAWCLINAQEYKLAENVMIFWSVTQIRIWYSFSHFMIQCGTATTLDYHKLS